MPRVGGHGCTWPWHFGAINLNLSEWHFLLHILPLSGHGCNTPRPIARVTLKVIAHEHPSGGRVHLNFFGGNNDSALLVCTAPVLFFRPLGGRHFWTRQLFRRFR